MARHADAGQCDRLCLGGGQPPSRSHRDLGEGDGEASDPLRRGHHRQGLRAGAQDRGRRLVAATGRRTRGNAQQVRALRRPAVSNAAPRGPRRVLFVTGKLAEPALRRTLAELAPDFAYDVAVLKITVAALMTAPWIARFLE